MTERETAKIFFNQKKTEMEKTKIFATNILNVIGIYYTYICIDSIVRGGL